MSDLKWIFGYGSLVWRPAFAHAERSPACVEGWARTEHAVRVFTRSVATRARTRGLRVAEQTTRSEQPGRDRDSGYAFDFCLRPTPEEGS